MTESTTLPRGPLVTLALGNFAIGMGSLVIAGIIRLIAKDTHVSVGTVGQLVTVYALTYAIASPLLVLSVGHLPRRTLLLVGLAGVLIGNLLGAVAPTFGMLVVGRIISALGAALFTPLASSVASAISPPAQRGQAIGLVFGGLTVATAFGVPLGTVLGNQFGWRVTLLVVALVSVVGMLAIWRTIAMTVTTPPVNLAAWGKVLRQGGLLLAVSVTLLQSTAQFVIFTYITPFLGRGLALGAGGITLMLLGFGVASIVGNFAAAQAGDNWGERRAVLVTLVALSAALALLSATHSILGAVIFCVIVWGIAGFGFNSPQQARLVHLAPQWQSALLALNASALYLGAAAGSALGGGYARGSSILSLGYIGGGIALLAVLALTATWSLEERRGNAAQAQAEPATS